MRLLLDAFSVLAIAAGMFFYLAGTVGLLRFPDAYTRLHALTKADNVGLGCVVLGLMLQAGDAYELLRLVLVWLLVMFAGSLACYLVAHSAVTAEATADAASPAATATAAPAASHDER